MKALAIINDSELVSQGSTFPIDHIFLPSEQKDTVASTGET